MEKEIEKLEIELNSNKEDLKIINSKIKEQNDKKGRKEEIKRLKSKLEFVSELLLNISVLMCGASLISVGITSIPVLKDVISMADLLRFGLIITTSTATGYTCVKHHLRKNKWKKNNEHIIYKDQSMYSIDLKLEEINREINKLTKVKENKISKINEIEEKQNAYKLVLNEQDKKRQDTIAWLNNYKQELITEPLRDKISNTNLYPEKEISKVKIKVNNE